MRFDVGQNSRFRQTSLPSRRPGSCWGLLAAMVFGAGIVLTYGSPLSAEDKPIRVLMVTQSVGYVHGSVRRPADTLSPAEIAVKQLAQHDGWFTVDCTQDAAADFTRENLQNYKLVFFYTTGALPITPENLDYFFKDWLRQPGHGFVGTHSATDTFGDYMPYWDMVGGTFAEHPWNAGNTVTIAVHDTGFPAMKPFGKEFQIKDEIYRYKNWQPEKVRVLMSLDMAKTEPKRPFMVPVSWVKDYGKGRVFYTNLGHNEGTWTNPRFLEHLNLGMQWAAGKIDGDATPNPGVSADLEERAKKDAGQ